MEEKINILVISSNDNCVTEVTDFLLQSKVSECNGGFMPRKSSNEALTIMEYAYSDGPPTVIKGLGPNNLRVYFVLKSFDSIKSDYHCSQRKMYSYDAVIMFLSDETDTGLILNYVRSHNYSNCEQRSHSLTIIGTLGEHIVQNINCGFSRRIKWSWNGKIAYNWSMHYPGERDNLWIHITKSYYRSTRVSYYSELILTLKISVIDFFWSLLRIICCNIDLIEKLTAKNGLLTLTREGDLYTIQNTQIRELLIQFNVLSLSEFERLLKEEMKQLACHLSPLAVLCDEIINFKDGSLSQLFHNFGGLQKFETLFLNELRSVNRVNTINVVLQSLDAMSEMKYTGHYIKNVLGIEKFDSLKSCLERHYSFNNMKIDVPTNTVDNLLGEAVKQDTQPENRIQKSLQKTLQEFTEELMRKLQEEFTKIMTKDNREIKERLSNLEQDNRELKEKLNKLEQKLDKASKKSLE